ncbi:hypothetical protein TNCV_390181 [Trichonephila clavipes]|nr:hypothetical protein TNCV_390181 [Trichonephila clavipes]
MNNSVREGDARHFRKLPVQPVERPELQFQDITCEEVKSVESKFFFIGYIVRASNKEPEKKVGSLNFSKMYKNALKEDFIRVVEKLNAKFEEKQFKTLNKETATHIGIREAEDWFRPIDLAKEFSSGLHGNTAADSVRSGWLLWNAAKSNAVFARRRIEMKLKLLDIEQN